MNAPWTEQTLFDDLVRDLPDHHRSEFFKNLHEAGISPNDIELARLLRSLQLYKAYYESIPAAVQRAAAEIERLKHEIDRLSADARRSSEASATCAGQVIQEAEHVRHGLTKIRDQVEEATRGVAEKVTGRMADVLSDCLETALQPLETVWLNLPGLTEHSTMPSRAAIKLRPLCVKAPPWPAGFTSEPIPWLHF